MNWLDMAIRLKGPEVKYGTNGLFGVGHPYRVPCKYRAFSYLTFIIAVMTR